MGRARSTKGEKRNVYRLLVGKPEGRKPLGRPRRRSVDNIRMDLVEAGWGDDWIGRPEDRDRWRALVKSVGIEHSGSIKCCETIKYLNN
jgi:hypothetical protein